MMGTLPPLKYEDIDGKRLRLLEDLDFLGVHVPAGFICDGQSWCIGEKRAARSAFVHDWIYSHNGAIPGRKKPYTRAQADKLFRQGLIKSGVTYTQSWTRWATLRCVGWVAWGEHKKRIEYEKNNAFKPIVTAP